MHMNNNSLKNKIYNEILDGINKGLYPLDQFLNEGELIKKFNVSKGPIREALIELCNENILRSIPRVGYQIVQLTEKNVKEAIELRFILETTGLKKIMTIINKNMLDNLVNLNREYEHQMKNDTLTIDQHWIYNNHFHLMLNSFAGNSYINGILCDTLKLIRRAYVQLYSNTGRDTYISTDLSRHMDIENYLRNKDFDNAMDLLKSDIMFIRGSLYVASDDFFSSL